MNVAVVMSGFPRRSETFALNELLALDAAGSLAAVFATKPGDGTDQPGVDRLRGKLRVLAPGSAAEQASEVARVLAGVPVDGIHGYFAHTPAEVASLAADEVGCRWGFSTHARDARKVTETQLLDRARRAACVVACNHDVAAHVAGAGSHVMLMPHGVDVSRFAPSDQPGDADGVRFLAVGRLVDKKGFGTLIDAAALAVRPWRVRIVGDGPLHDQLVGCVDRLGVGHRVSLAGPMTHHELPAEYAAAHALVAPSLVNAEGDRDGLPNVVLEAMACGRPVVASDVGAVSAAVDDETTGLLVRPADATALASALDRLASDGALRARLGRAARARVESDYRLDRCSRRFVELLERVYA